MAAERSAAAVIVTLLLGLCASPVWACRCVPQSLEDYFDRAEVVMQVRIEQVEIVEDGDGPVHRRAQFRRLHDYKNGAGIESLRTAVDGAACGLELQPGMRYWIFGSLAPGSSQVSSGSCDGSRPVEQGFNDVAADAVHGALLDQRSTLDCPSPARGEIAARLQLASVPRTETTSSGQRSPNGAYTFRLEEALQVKDSPRTVNLLIDHERDQLLELRLLGVTASPSAQWVNEKLVLVRVLWSAYLRSDVLVDVDRAEILSVDSAQLDDAGRVQRWLDEGCRRSL